MGKNNFLGLMLVSFLNRSDFFTTAEPVTNSCESTNFHPENWTESPCQGLYYYSEFSTNLSDYAGAIVPLGESAPLQTLAPCIATLAREFYRAGKEPALWVPIRSQALANPSGNPTAETALQLCAELQIKCKPSYDDDFAQAMQNGYLSLMKKSITSYSTHAFFKFLYDLYWIDFKSDERLDCLINQYPGKILNSFFKSPHYFDKNHSHYSQTKKPYIEIFKNYFLSRRIQYQQSYQKIFRDSFSSYISSLNEILDFTQIKLMQTPRNYGALDFSLLNLNELLVKGIEEKLTSHTESKLQTLPGLQAAIVISENNRQTQRLENVARLFPKPREKKIEKSTDLSSAISQLAAHALYRLSENKDEGRCRSSPSNGA